MSESGKGPRKIKVVDRRRFDESGDLRPDRPSSERPKPAAAPTEKESAPSESATGPAAPSPSEPAAQEPLSAPTTSPLFMDLVAGLAQQAEMLLTGGQGVPAQPAEAQRLIEYLAMLETKTRGNLSGEEKQVLSGVVFQLRSLFVQHNA